jgi:hypothetical protein
LNVPAPAPGAHLVLSTLTPVSGVGAVLGGPARPHDVVAAAGLVATVVAVVAGAVVARSGGAGEHVADLRDLGERGQHEVRRERGGEHVHPQSRNHALPIGRFRVSLGPPVLVGPVWLPVVLGPW